MTHPAPRITTELGSIRKRVAEAAARAGRPADDVQLIAVSKTHPVPAIRAAHTAGQMHFGESYAQELRDKAPELPDAHWHFIGRIQSNKIRYIAPHAYRVHALERLDHARELARRAQRVVRCLVAVNTGGEAAKSGVAPEEALEAVRSLGAVDGIEVVGLMTLPPRVSRPQDAAPYFEQLAELAARGRAEGLALHELSMGMTADFEVAIAHGATWVRVGTAIFGPRAT